MARKIVAGNWKMNLLPKEGLKLIQQLTNYSEDQDLNHLEVVVAPPTLYLSEAADIARGKKLSIAAQNCHDQKSGAFTGEISVPMIESCGAELVIIGHSERRQYFHETDEFLNSKLKQCFNSGLIPILCVGEMLEDRKAGRQEEVVRTQLDKALKGFWADTVERILVAYEPVWAIGTGETATPDQAQEMHHFIRNHFSKVYNSSVADEISILYGGSVKPENAREIFSEPDVDGGLVGGASLKFDSFKELIQIGSEVLR